MVYGRIIKMVNYQQGKIYKIVNDVDNKEYVGSTCKPRLCQRWQEHKSASKGNRVTHYKLYQHMNTIGIEHFRIELIESFQCNSKDELRAREGHFIKTLKPCLNGRIEGRTDSEYRRDNQERIKASKSEWYNTHKQEYLSRHKQIMECFCGNTYTKSHRSEHLKSKKHQLYIQFGELNNIDI